MHRWKNSLPPCGFAVGTPNGCRARRHEIKNRFYRPHRRHFASRGKPHAAVPDDIAFVQYSSGSTSEPKGVALTHHNLLTNIAAIAQGIKLTEADSGLSWMPLTHDMGLIGFHLTPFVMNVDTSSDVDRGCSCGVRNCGFRRRVKSKQRSSARRISATGIF